MPASTSALCVTSVPARVTGREPPAIAMLRMLSGQPPARADSMMTSVASRGSLSGLTGQTPQYDDRAARAARPRRRRPRRTCVRCACGTRMPESGPMPIGLVVLSSCRLGVVHGGRLRRHVAWRRRPIS